MSYQRFGFSTINYHEQKEIPLFKLKIQFRNFPELRSNYQVGLNGWKQKAV